MLDQLEVQFAVAAVREAGHLVRRVQAEMATSALTKGDKSPVTVGDFAAQAVVARRLQAAFPHVGLIGEESAEELRAPAHAETLGQILHFVRSSFPDATLDEVCDWIDLGADEPSSPYWTLDPIDGTKGFLRGDQYAVALALIVEGRVEVGALACPELQSGATPAKGGPGSILLGVRGQGALCRSMDEDDWKPLKTSSNADPTRTRLLRSVEKSHTNLGAIDHLAEAMGIEAQPIGMDSQAKYAVLAAGGGDMLVRLISPSRADYREKIWDQAAGSIVIEEAGGRVTDLDGKPLDFSHGRTLAQNRGVLATNGLLHEPALSGLREIGA